MTAELTQAVAAVRQVAGDEPCELAVILGSGLGEVVETLPVDAVIPYAELPCLPRGQIAGHRGQLAICRWQGRRLALFQGRFHLYQGLSARQAAMPVVLARALGCRRLLLTNASGGLGEGFAPGEFMLINDHINLMGDNPLRGETEQPFVNLCGLYRTGLYPELQRLAAADGWRLHQGVLCGMSGPSYETPAEIRAVARLGGDAVSMSTIPEAIMAAYLQLPVMGLALIANRAAGLTAAPLNHDEVLAVGRSAVKRLRLLLEPLASVSEWP